ncbi:hypothetical protein [Brevibacillus reuszeri]|uniref:hypothetical protein n=1 Tax=Brevibacillus reuszeri TaxID=54915 RepID=UPI0013DED9DF|nr:hypothetical protein [Brevibacillus reuszeri]
MEKINTVVDGRLMAVPVLTPKHIAAINKIQTGVSPAPDILRDLIDAGLVEDAANDLAV